MTRKKRFAELKNLLSDDADVVLDNAPPVQRIAPSNTTSNFPPLPAIQAAIANTGNVKKSRTLVFADVASCVPWRFADRHFSQVTDESCEELIDDIRKNGQEVPAIARRIENPTGQVEFEIISGRRRLYACSKTKDKQILLDVRSMDDQQAAKIMVKENENRKNISEFERAISLVQQLKDGLWKSIEEMRREYEDLDKKAYSPANFSKTLTAGRLSEYEQIISILPKVADVKVRPAYELVGLIEKDKATKEVILKRAWKLKEKINQGVSLTTPQILKDLLESIKYSEKIDSVKYIGIEKHPKAIECKETQKQWTLKIDKKSLSGEGRKKILEEIEKLF